MASGDAPAQARARRGGFGVSASVQVVGLTALAFGLRMFELLDPVLRWDEGWTLAHAALDWPALLRIAAQEWHPLGYYALMKLWLALGVGMLGARYASVLLGTLAVPVAYQVARLWDGGRARTGVWAAALCAWYPLLVYYGQVARMYPLATLGVLLTGWALMVVVHAPERAGWRGLVWLALASGAALLTQYYVAWPLAALYAYGALVRPRRIPVLVGAGVSALVLFLPWLLFAYPALSARLATGATRAVDPLTGTLDKLPLTLDGLLYAHGSGWVAPAALAGVLVLGVVVGLRRRADVVALSLPVLAAGIALVGVSYGAQASGWTAPHRHMMLTAGIALLALAWAFERLQARHIVLAASAVLVLVSAYAPTSLAAVYAKNLEVVDPFDPSMDAAYLHGRARADEVVFFNVLARAGWYTHYRQAGDPAWDYAMRWDPIIEPLDDVSTRISATLARVPRVWLVMHEGAYGPNGPLVDWLDAHAYPASAEWRADPPMTHTLYLSYVAPTVGWVDARVPQAVGPFTLVAARYTERVEAGGALAAELAWTAAGPQADATVYVHWLDVASGALVAQHDSVPGAGRRPTSGWGAQEVVVDRHGARLPDGWRGALRVEVGWYDPVTGVQVGAPVVLGVVQAGGR